MCSIIKEDICIDAQERSKNFAPIIKSSLFKGIFIDGKDVNCASLETACKKIFLITISEDLFQHKHHLVSEFIGYHICKVNVLEMKYLRSLVGGRSMDRVRNEEVRRRAGIDRELSSRRSESIEMVWACGKNG